MDIFSKNKKPFESSQRSSKLDVIRLPGRFLLIVMALVAPWWPVASQTGWAQATLGLLALIALALWWFEQATQKTKQTILPISILPLLLGVCLGIYHFVPWSSGFVQSLGNQTAYQRWDDLGSNTESDQEVAEVMNQQLEVKKPLALPTVTKTISIDPEGTRLMTAQLVLAAICFFLGAHYFHNRNAILAMCIALAINGAAIAIFGMIQKATCGPNELYYGLFQTEGTVFGPYVNRNNAAGLLCMSMAAAAMVITVAFGQDKQETGDKAKFLTQNQTEKGLFISLLKAVHELTASKIAITLIFTAIMAGIFVSLSRGGVMAAILGSAVSFVIIGLNQRGEKKGAGYLGIAILIGIILVVWLGYGDQLMERFNKAETQNLEEHGRVENWADTLQSVPDALITGTGLNTYQHIHRGYRTTVEEGSNLYFYAENQYFQALIEGGVVGLALLLSVFFLAVYYTIFLNKMSFSNRGFSVAILAAFALTSQAVAAFFDFGLYLPANFITFALIMGAVSGAAQFHANRLKVAPWLIRVGLGRVGIVIMLILFSGGVLALREFYQEGEVQQAVRLVKNIKENGRKSTLEEVDQALRSIHKLNRRRQSSKLYIATADLQVLRYQLTVFNNRTKGTEDLDDKQLDQIWAFSSFTADSLIRIVEIKQFNPLQAKRLKAEFVKSKLAQNNLFPAYWNLLKARNLSPMTPRVHFQLADLTMVLTEKSAEPHMLRALKISPMNARYNMLAGIRYLWLSNYDRDDPRFDVGKKHIQKALDLVPALFPRIEQSIVRAVYPAGVYPGFKPREFAAEFLTNSPELMIRYVNQNQVLKNNLSVKKELLTTILENLQKDTEEPAKSKKRINLYNRHWSMARIYFELEMWESAIKPLQNTLLLRGNNRSATEKLVRCYTEIGEFKKAEEVLLDIRARVESESLKRRYKKMLTDLERKKLLKKN